MADGISWTMANLGIETIAGALGAHAAAVAAHEHRFGFIGHTAIGILAGAASGYFLQTMASPW